MKRLLLFVCVVVVFAVAAYPQSLTGELKVNVPHPFMAAGQELPAGNYTIIRSGLINSVLLIRGEKGKIEVGMDVLARIDISRAPERDAKIVLDRVEGDHYILSEVFFPEEDGFLIAEAKLQKH